MGRQQRARAAQGRPQARVGAIAAALGLMVRARAARQAGDGAGAEALYRQALALDPKQADAWLGLAAALVAKGDPRAARETLLAALARGVLVAEHLGQQAIAAYHEGRDGDALALLDAACAAKPGLAALHADRGLVLFEMRRLAEAVAAFNAALAADPAHVEAYINLGSICAEGRQVQQAIQFFRQALRLRPDDPVALYGLSIQRRHACEWRGGAAEEAQLTRVLERTGARTGPFMRLAARVPAAEHLRAARVWAQGVRVKAQDILPPVHEVRAPGRRIRVGYLSRDLFAHATAFLAVEAFERHDRARFETFAYSYGPDDGSPMRRRLVDAFDHFVEVGDLSNAEAARRIRADGIDILVDLKGYTFGCRTEILALRPAPVQVNFLGYPGTMGAPFMDYIVGDSFVTPLEAAPLYDEKIVQLPGTYQPNDSRRAIAAQVPARAACGLPERGFVFCCFNNTYKITPDIFAVWMRLLAAVPGSVLWLFEANDVARDNLHYEAGALGVDPGRIVFAPRAEPAEHLARHRHADLVLDTLPYNAHTTASDALWAGVPLVTCAGESFASRVAGSLLHAVGLPELVTHTLAEYETLALALARDPQRLADLRARLAANRADADLFDATRYVRGLEAAYERMHALRCAGKAPQAISIMPQAMDIGPGAMDIGPGAVSIVPQAGASASRA
ncbi:O-linked N-acetylglucosamine transferase, SPINDLY family protein [Roseixanthobacter liquoris]|uniref:O-linked N-acetylglucosamine transferase, SPINDLY family protein n=1 Tax=Roseixanthobacter liquoris TaxID=3119921 RepID=UPI003728FD76